MSRWLANVGQFLEKLDSQAKDVVEERMVLSSNKADTDANEISGDKIDQILAERGLLSETVTNEEESENDFDLSVHHNSSAKANEEARGLLYDKSAEDVIPAELDPLKVVRGGSNESESERSLMAVDSDKRIDGNSDDISSPKIHVNNEVTSSAEANSSEIAGTDLQTAGQTISLQQLEATADNTEAVLENEAENQTNESDKNGESESTSVPSLNDARAGPLSELQPRRQSPDEEMVPISLVNAKLNELALVRQSHEKEIKKLKRNIVSLNAHLEATEKEMMAQRKELENAGMLMQKDRSRNKEMLESLTSKNNMEVAALKLQHEQYVKELQSRHDEHLRQLKEEFDSLERIRKQEGGDYTKELHEALQREQQVLSENAMLVDEKETLLQQISTLQSQQEALGMRLESLAHSADMATEREIEAERRLDETLEMHARQLSQRQARETELERTVAELGSALVALQASNASTHDVAVTSPTGHSTATDQTAGDVTSQIDSDRRFEVSLQALEQENDSLRLQLAQEAHRASTFSNELEELSKERAEETSLFAIRQQQHDRAIDDLNRQISQLKSDLCEAKNLSRRDSDQQSMRSSDEAEDAKRIKTLSEEILRQREKLSSYSSEISALRTRLNVALNRATVAEAVAEQQAGGGVDIEGGKLPVNIISSGNSNFGAPMRRGRKEREGTDIPSMKRALMLENAYGQKSVKFAEILDAVDAILVRLGRLLRLNPFMRLFFVIYLLMVHVWAFVILFYHAHYLDSVPRGQSHGPHTMMLQQAIIKPLMNSSVALTSGN